MRDATDDDFADRLAASRLLAERKAAAASAAREVAFAAQPIAAVGEPVWQELWEPRAASTSTTFPDRLRSRLAPTASST